MALVHGEKSSTVLLCMGCDKGFPLESRYSIDSYNRTKKEMIDGRFYTAFDDATFSKRF